MKTKSYLHIRKFLYVLLSLMIILSVFAVNNTPLARAQAAWTATPTVTATTAIEVIEAVAEPPTPIPTVVPTTIDALGLGETEIAHWIEYRDEMYGYGLAVPSTWSIYPASTEGIVTTATFMNYYAVQLSGKESWPANAIKIEMQVYNINIDESLKTWFPKHIEEVTWSQDAQSASMHVVSTEEITLGMQSALKSTLEDKEKNTSSMIAVRLSTEKALIISILPENNWSLAEVSLILNSLVTSKDEIVQLPTTDPMPLAVFDLGNVQSNDLQAQVIWGCDRGSEVGGSPISLQMPFSSGTTWSVGGNGSYYGDNMHVNNDYYATDWNMGVYPNTVEDYGQSVYPVAGGTAYVGSDGGTGYGTWVDVYHDGGQVRTRYAHLSAVSIQNNSRVEVTTKIGEVGSSGSSANHLHLSFWFNVNGQWNSAYGQGRRPSPMQTSSGSWELCDGQSRTVANKATQSNCPVYNFEGVVFWDQDNCYGSTLSANGSTGVVNLTDYGWNDRAESIYVKNGWSVRVWQDINAGLATSCIYGSKWDLNQDTYETNSGRSMHRDITSIKVFQNSSCTDNSLPGTAVLSSPGGNIGANYIPTYTWNQVSGSTWYYLWVNGPSGNVIKKWYTSAQANCNGSTCSVKHGTVLSGGSHTWWIQTWNSSGYGPWSAAKYFNTTSPMPIPGSTGLISPSGSGQGNQPTFTWNQVNGATWYYLWVSTNSGTFYTKWYTSASVNCNGSTCSVKPAIWLPGGYTRWWIQTWNPSGYGPWSGLGFYP